MDIKIKKFIGDNPKRKQLYEDLGCPTSYCTFMDKISELFFHEIVLKEKLDLYTKYNIRDYSADNIPSFVDRYIKKNGIKPKELYKKYGFFYDSILGHVINSPAKKQLYETLGAPSNYDDFKSRLSTYIKSMYVIPDKLMVAVIFARQGIFSMNPGDDEARIILETIRLQISNGKTESPYILLIEKILTMDDTEMVQYLKECGINSKDFSIIYSNSVKDYLECKYGGLNYPESEYLKIRSKLSAYKKYLEKEKLIKIQEKFIQDEKDEVESLYDAYSLVSNYIASDATSIKSYCEKNAIDENLFHYYIDILRKYSANDYLKYQERANRNSSNYYYAIIEFIKKVVAQINNGVILDDGSVRSFDLLDYYLMGGNRYDDKKMLEIVKNQKSIFSSSEVSQMIKFLRKYEKKGSTNIEQVAYTTVYKFQLPNKEIRELSLEEKQKLVKYLYLNGIPFNSTTFNLVIKRYISGEIQLEELSMENTDIKK